MEMRVSRIAQFPGAHRVSWVGIPVVAPSDREWARRTRAVFTVVNLANPGVCHGVFPLECAFGDGWTFACPVDMVGVAVEIRWVSESPLATCPPFDVRLNWDMIK